EISKQPKVILEALLQIGDEMISLDHARAQEILQLGLRLAENTKNFTGRDIAHKLLGKLRAKNLFQNSPSQPGLQIAEREANQEPVGHPGTKKQPNVLAQPPQRKISAQLHDPQAPPVVTIVTPFFNADETFRQTAASVFAQSLQQWEWLIINDASSRPDSVALLGEFGQKDHRIRVIDHEVNQGPGAARNTGFRQARSNYVFQLDADDLIEPTALEKLWWHL